MKIKNKFQRKKTIILGLLLGFICLQQTIISETINESDFSIEIEKNELIFKVGETISTTVLINSSTTLKEDIQLSGEWIGEILPKNVLVEISSLYGNSPFSSDVKFISNNNSETGNFYYNLIASIDDEIRSCEIKISLKSNLTLSIQTDNDSYTKGQNIEIFGNITEFNQENFLSEVNISFSYDNWKRQVSTSLINYSFEYDYKISYGDPQGTWNITAEVFDIHGFKYIKSKNILVDLPLDIVRYTVVLFSPPRDAVYIRGNTINISCLITENGIGVKNALTRCTLFSNESINLNEVNDGYYQESYKIPFNSKMGQWSLSVESTKKVGNSIRVGGSNTIIEVKPIKLKLNLIEPVENEYSSGDFINIRLDLKYPDGSIVGNATVTANTPRGKLKLINIENGTYEVNFSISSDKKGSWFIEIFASDQFGNNVSKNKIIYIIYEDQFILSFTSMLGLIGLGLFVIIAVYIFRKRYSIQHFKDIQEEIKEVERLQNETAIYYYKKGTISREIYNVLRKEHASRLTELKNEEKKIIKNRNKEEKK
jgi:hypothetical protein